MGSETVALIRPKVPLWRFFSRRRPRHIITRTARRAPASMPGKKPAIMATPGKALHWVAADAAATAVEEDAVGEGIVVAMLGTLEGFGGALVDAEDDVEDAEEEDVEDVCLFITHMLFWHE